LLTAGYVEAEMWAVALIHDHHVSALRRAGSNEEQFHAAFEGLRNDPAVDDRIASGIANAITGAGEEWFSKAAAMGAIEHGFYAQAREQNQEQVVARGRS
jgi:protein-disulfide isomerase-like protein with CxxC motif